ncbi:MAG TPA: 3-keto-5-aminohexanoate cleavage protein [Bradyrhizobium sp.]|nr:3-keto-5-aminohexanoate cleavage protein [Bradyrhizobium sp.]
MDQLIIEACLNGSRPRSENPNIPCTPDEILAEAKRCADAGASIVHVHARTAEGGISYDPDWYAEVAERIASETELILNVTTTRFGGVPREQIFDYLRRCAGWLEMIALNCGAIVINRKQADGHRRSLEIPNNWDDLLATLAVCRDLDITPEPATFDVGFLSTLVALVADGAMERPRYLLLEFASRLGDGIQAIPGTPAAYALMADLVRGALPGTLWAAHGGNESCFLIAGLAISTGAHARLGFEDRVTLPDGRLARSNAELVSWAAEAARLYGRRPASPAETRQLVGLRRNKPTRLARRADPQKA